MRSATRSLSLKPTYKFLFFVDILPWHGQQQLVEVIEHLQVVEAALAFRDQQIAGVHHVSLCCRRPLTTPSHLVLIFQAVANTHSVTHHWMYAL
jgi:hypothetical protein